MMLLNGAALPIKQMSIRAGFRIEEKDLSGSGSSTATAEAGIKPQTLTVSGIIDQKRPGDLARLAALARAKDTAGAMVQYAITNATAQALQIRKVRFCDNFTVTEGSTQRLWQVSFTLKEIESVPEKVEARGPVAAASEAGADAPSGEAIAASFEGVYNQLGEALA